MGVAVQRGLRAVAPDVGSLAIFLGLGGPRGLTGRATKVSLPPDAGARDGVVTTPDSVMRRPRRKSVHVAPCRVSSRSFPGGSSLGPGVPARRIWSRRIARS
jgi:hypothetical protein